MPLTLGATVSQASAKAIGLRVGPSLSFVSGSGRRTGGARSVQQLPHEVRVRHRGERPL